MEILTKDQLWRHMLRTEPRHRFPRYLWGGLLLWIIERFDGLTKLGAIIVIIGAVVAILIPAVWKIGGWYGIAGLAAWGVACFLIWALIAGGSSHD